MAPAVLPQGRGLDRKNLEIGPRWLAWGTPLQGVKRRPCWPKNPGRSPNQRPSTIARRLARKNLENISADCSKSKRCQTQKSAPRFPQKCPAKKANFARAPRQTIASLQVKKIARAGAPAPRVLTLEARFRRSETEAASPRNITPASPRKCPSGAGRRCRTGARLMKHKGDKSNGNKPAHHPCYKPCYRPKNRGAFVGSKAH